MSLSTQLREADTKYKRRTGTSGVQGHLYESKLLSLILFRAQQSETVVDFTLSTNVADIGAFDDICFKANIQGHSRPLIAFIQAKHKINNENLLTLESENDLDKYFNSYIEIKQKFNPASEDKIFNEHFDNTECFFVLYTNVGSESKEVFQHNYAEFLNRLIATGKLGSKPHISDEAVQLLSTRYTAKTLAKHFAKFLYSKNNETLMDNDYIISYHIVLAAKVVEVSEANRDRKKCTFRQDFFNNTDLFIVMFRGQLYKEILKMQEPEERPMEELSLETFLSEPSEKTLTLVIERIVTHENGKFKLVNNTTNAYTSQLLDKIKLSQSTVNKVIESSAIEILKSSEFSVPILFGNMDLKLRGNTNKKEKRLNYLASSIVDLIEKSKPATDIVLDASVSDGLLLLNGGLASAVGRLLVYDDNDTRFIKFTNNITILKDHDKRLLEKINSRVENLGSYRFEVRDKTIPKLSFDCIDKGLVSQFLSKLVFYTYQGDHNCVERTLKRDIEEQQRQNHNITSPFNYMVSSEAIYLKYHDRIQKWWMSKDKLTPYLTKYCDVYDQAVKSILKNPQISSMNIMYLNKIKLIENKIQFNEKYIESFRDELLIGKIIFTNRIILTTVKVLQCLKFHERTVLDLNYVIPLSIDEIITTNAELRNRDENDKLIIIYDSIRFISKDKIKKLFEAVQMQNNIVITNSDQNCEIIEYFSNLSKTYSNTYQFTHLTDASQTNILNESSVIVHGSKIRLDTFVNNVPKEYIKGDILDQIIQTNTLFVSELPLDFAYEKIKDLYVDRIVQRGEEVKPLHTLFDIIEDVVIITGDAGAGKSILLSHLYLETIKTDIKHSVVRINLSEHSALFSRSQLHGISIDPLHFVYYEIIHKHKNKLWDHKNLCSVDLHPMLYMNQKVCRDEFIAGDDIIEFELNMLLHHYDNGRMIFLFDGFDEICPDYSRTVINLLKDINNTAQKNKIWITTRSYTTIVSELEINFGTSYKLKHLTKSQLDTYLNAFWKLKLPISELKNVDTIIHQLDRTSAQNFLANATLSPSIGKVKASLILHLIKICPVDGKTRWHELYSTLQFLLDHDQRGEHEASAVAAHDTHEVENLYLIYLAATFFADRILDDRVNIKRLSFDVDVSSLYEEIILTMIRKYFQDTVGINIYCAGVRNEFEKAVQEVITELKMVAAHTIFENTSDNMFNRDQFEKIKYFINAIKSGDKKIGVICNVTNNVPHFVHRTFAEYLAVEYLFNILQTMGNDERGILVEDLSGHITLLSVWINNKLSKKENEELRCYFSDKIDILVPFPTL